MIRVDMSYARTVAVDGVTARPVQPPHTGTVPDVEHTAGGTGRTCSPTCSPPGHTDTSSHRPNGKAALQWLHRTAAADAFTAFAVASLQRRLASAGSGTLW